MLSRRYLNDGVSAIQLNETQKEYLKIFLDKCHAGIYKQEYLKCECGNDTGFEILSEKDRYGLPVRTVICPCCGLVMTNPRMMGESYDKFYESEYPLIYRAIKKPDDEYLEKRVKYGNELVDFIEKKSGVNGREVLEIGCAGGGIVKAFQDRGYKALGVDLSSTYIEFGQKKGINVRCCHSSELLKEEKLYDIIILNHVLEHLTDLKKELSIIRSLLKPQGILFIAVPGIKNLLFSYNNDFLLFLQNAHVYHFSKDTLVQVLRWHGFDVVYANERIEAIFQMGERDNKKNNFYMDIKLFLEELESNRQDVFPMLCKRIQHIISDYKEGEVAVYGTGNEANKLMKEIGKPLQIKGFLTKDIIEEQSFLGYPILNLGNLQGIKCVIIASKIYKKVIYERIKILEENGITLVQLYE